MKPVIAAQPRAGAADECAEMLRLSNHYLVTGEVGRGVEMALDALRCAAKCQCARHLSCSQEARRLVAEVKATALRNFEV